MKKRLLYCTALFLLMNRASFAADRGEMKWTGSWAASPTLMHMSEPLGDSTIRDVVHLTLGGTAIRVVLTNQFGRVPLRVGSATVAVPAGSGGLEPGSEHKLTFDRQPSVSIPAESYVLSDPIPMPVTAFSDLAISLYLPAQTIADPTCHERAISSNYIASGNQAKEIALPDARRFYSWCFLQDVEVYPKNRGPAAIVALGDSITDGAYSTIDANHRYTDYLALRLHAKRKTAHLSVLNEGISGGRVLFDGHGPSALRRFDRDVLAQPGVRYVIYLEGINDIGQLLRANSPERTLTLDDLTFAAQQMITRAHMHGVKVFGATLLPAGTKNEPNPTWVAMRRLIDGYNDWVRTSHAFDGIIDFNKALADPDDPDIIRPAYDRGDHVHPNDAGYKAMADAIDPALFRR
ncbi:MAG TPA: SGNH/GDSL hydrolase family protein [Acidobacteriaceae bacterium]|nr:SGNH/GDSL hydrolase family protein [Acidobacteriaceae bacterium]